MIFTFEAIYENRAFRPLEPLPEGLFEEGERLVLVIDYGGNRMTIHRKSEAVNVNASEVNSNGDPD